MGRTQTDVERKLHAEPRMRAHKRPEHIQPPILPSRHSLRLHRPSDIQRDPDRPSSGIRRRHDGMGAGARP
jgi:hypothetical protein